MPVTTSTHSYKQSKHPLVELTPQQRDIWVANAMRPDSSQFTCFGSITIEGPIDASSLARAARETMAEHDAWRTRIVERDGVPYQFVVPDADSVDVIDFRGFEDPAGEVSMWMRSEAQQYFALTEGEPVSRLAVAIERDDRVVLHVAVNHVVIDGLSGERLIDEVVGRLSPCGVPASTDAEQSVATSYVDHAKSLASSIDRAREAEEFANTLADLDPVTFSRTREGSTRRNVLVHESIDMANLRGLRELSVSSAGFLAAGLAILLCRIHGATDIAIGLLVANRRESNFLSHGSYASALPLRVFIDDDESFLKLAQRVSASIREVKKYEHLSLGEVLRAGDFPQMFDVNLSYMKTAPTQSVDGLHIESTMRSPVHVGDALSILVRSFDDRPDANVDLDGDPAVFDSGFPLDGFTESFMSILAQCEDDPSRFVGSIETLSAQQSSTLAGLESGPRTRLEGTADTISGAFESAAREHPERPAVHDWNGSISTYGEVRDRARAVAGGLAAAGVGRGDRVAVILARGVDLIPSLLGVMMCGAAYVPIDPDYPGERIAFVVDDCDASAIIVDSGSLAVEYTGGRSVHTPDSLASSGVPTPSIVVTPADTAYVIYTSGSTGTPKGAAVSHRAIHNRIAWMQDAYALDSDDVILQKTPISFDVSVWELFWWAYGGAAVVLARPGAHKDPEQVLDAMIDGSVTIAHFVPSMLGPFLETVRLARPETAAGLARLRRVFASGEALPSARVVDFDNVFRRPGFRDAGAEPIGLSNLYGPTEASVDVSFHDCKAEMSAATVPIGRPIDGVSLHVLDSRLRRVPVGHVGELYIGGVAVADFYHRRRGLTATRFVAHPFGEGRLYRTGDVARWSPTGELDFLGRNDGQVKIRGNRVETAEVESALLAVPGCREAAVLAADGALTGYCVVDAGTTVDDVRRALARAVPEFMVPTTIVPLDEFPMTPNGKLDRKSLPLPRETLGEPDLVRAPRTDVERILAETFADILGVPSVGIDDSFFALGGDSISAMRLRIRAKERGVTFSLADLASDPTVAGLCSAQTSDTDSDVAPAPFDLVPRMDALRLFKYSDALPLSRMQLGMIFHSQQHEESLMYHDAFRYSFSGEWDVDRLRSSLDAVSARHSVLSSIFDLTNYSVPLQIFGCDARACVSVTYVDSGDGVAQLFEDSKAERYGSSTTPWYRLDVVVSPAGMDVLFAFHHALLDGASVAAVIADLVQEYAGGRTGEVTGDTEILARSLVAETAALDDGAHAEFWEEELAGARPAELPDLRAHGAMTAPGVGPAEWIAAGADVPTKLARFAREHTVSTKSILVAAFTQTLRLVCGGADDLITGLVTHNRPAVAGGDLAVGMFLNTVPMRIASNPSTWVSAVRDIDRRDRASYVHKAFPISAIAELSNRGAPPFVTAFNHIDFRQLGDALGPDGATLESVDVAERTNFDVLLNTMIDPRDGTLRLRLESNPARVVPAQRECVTSYFLGILDRILAEPDEPVGFSFLASEGPGISHRPSESTVVTMFDDRVSATPDAVAVVHDSERWTYRELARRSDDICAAIREQVHHPRRIVTVVGRGLPYVAALIGIMKSGAACVPIDVSYPQSRIRDLLAEIDPDVVLVDGSVPVALDSVPEVHVADVDSSSADPRSTIDPRSTAYVLFTSGSTGRPKAVAMPHVSLANLVRWQNWAISGKDSRDTLQFASLGFDVSFQEIFSTLCSGGTLHMIDDSRRKDMSALSSVLRASTIDRLYLPYVALEQLAQTCAVEDVWPDSLDVVISSGEQLRITGAVREFLVRADVRVLENQYGPTESHVVTVDTRYPRADTVPVLPPIGRPIPGAHVSVVDSSGRVLPAGGIGELWISGVCLADGYFRRDDLTSAAFVDDEHGERCYRTGDIGLYDPELGFLCLGRADRQVKVRGYRVEPGEVESILLTIDGVREVAVLDSVRPDGETVLSAYTVVDDDELTIGAITGILRNTVPAHMVPSRLVAVESIPVTASGKRDDDALRRTPLVDDDAVRRSRAVADPFEAEVLTVVAQLLGDDDLHVDEDLFARGATSLTTIKLSTALAKTFGRAMPIARIIEAPTVRGMSSWLRSSAPAPENGPMVELTANGDGRDLARLFIVHPMGGGVGCYLPLSKHLDGTMDVYALQAPGFDGSSTPISSIPDMAEYYLSHVLEVQPSGPYFIGGWSFGGYAAFEMVTQLRARGEDVHLIVIDSTAVNPDGYSGPIDHTVVDWFFLELMWTHSAEEEGDLDTPGESASMDSRLQSIADRAVRAGVLNDDGALAVIERMFDLYRAHLTAVKDYRPQPLSGQFALIRASEPMPDSLLPMHTMIGSDHQAPDNGWSRWTVSAPTVDRVPGDHLTLMTEPHVRSVAESIAKIVGERVAER